MQRTILRATVVLAVTVPAFSNLEAQPGRGRGPGALITELRIGVEDLNTRQIRDYVLPGQELTLQAGDRVRLRMYGVPAGDPQRRRWPHTRFYVDRPHPTVFMSQIKVDPGSAVLETRQTRGPAPRGVAIVGYELAEELDLARGVPPKGTISVRVVDPPPAVKPQPRRGVTLYEHQDFRGRSETFFADDPELRDNHIGPDTASSLRLDPGCEVTLYEHPNFTGRASVITSDTTDLRGSRVGNDTVSGLQLRCGGDDRPRRRGVTLFEHQDFQGRSETFFDRDEQLSDNHVRQDTASSVRVDPGCRVVLYEHPYYEGRATALAEDTVDLRNTRVGSDTVSSLTVECDGR